jgi:hypothetical protein
MPTILRVAGYRFFFYSDEGDPREPPHIHVAAGEKTAKFWLDPVELAISKNLRSGEISGILSVVEEHRDVFLEAWNAHFES